MCVCRKINLLAHHVGQPMTLYTREDHSQLVYWEVGYTGRSLHHYAYAINTKYDSIGYLLSFTHGSCAFSSSELFRSPKQSGNDNLKSFPPGIRFIATSSWSIKCLHLKKNSLQSLMQNLVIVLFARHGGML